MEVGGVVGEHGQDEKSAFDEVNVTPFWWSWKWGIDVAEECRFCVTGGVVVWEAGGSKGEIGRFCQGVVHEDGIC